MFYFLLTAMRKILLVLAMMVSMYVSANVFGSAKWIGVSGKDLPFCPDYLPVFRIECDVDIVAGGSGSVIYGLNDPRLMNRNLNIYNIENPVDSSGIRVEIDGAGKLAVYRSGYHPADDGNKPLAVFDADVRPGRNHLSIASNLGRSDFYLNGTRVGRVGLNPVGNGGDYLAFPVLGGMAVHKNRAGVSRDN